MRAAYKTHSQSRSPPRSPRITPPRSPRTSPPASPEIAADIAAEIVADIAADNAAEIAADITAEIATDNAAAEIAADIAAEIAADYASEIGGVRASVNRFQVRIDPARVRCLSDASGSRVSSTLAPGTGNTVWIAGAASGCPASGDPAPPLRIKCTWSMTTHVTTTMYSCVHASQQPQVHQLSRSCPAPPSGTSVRRPLPAHARIPTRIPNRNAARAASERDCRSCTHHDPVAARVAACDVT